jgi:hypothetical protein
MNEEKLTQEDILKIIDECIEKSSYKEIVTEYIRSRVRHAHQLSPIKIDLDKQMECFKSDIAMMLLYKALNHIKDFNKVNSTQVMDVKFNTKEANHFLQQAIKVPSSASDDLKDIIENDLPKIICPLYLDRVRTFNKNSHFNTDMYGNLQFLQLINEDNSEIVQLVAFVYNWKTITRDLIEQILETQNHFQSNDFQRLKIPKKNIHKELLDLKNYWTNIKNQNLEQILTDYKVHKKYIINKISTLNDLSEGTIKSDVKRGHKKIYSKISEITKNLSVLRDFIEDIENFDAKNLFQKWKKTKENINKELLIFRDFLEGLENWDEKKISINKSLVIYTLNRNGRIFDILTGAVFYSKFGIEDELVDTESPLDLCNIEYFLNTRRRARDIESFSTGINLTETLSKLPQNLIDSIIVSYNRNDKMISETIFLNIYNIILNEIHSRLFNLNCTTSSNPTIKTFVTIYNCLKEYSPYDFIRARIDEINKYLNEDNDSFYLSYSKLRTDVYNYHIKNHRETFKFKDRKVTSRIKNAVLKGHYKNIDDPKHGYTDFEKEFIINYHVHLLEKSCKIIKKVCPDLGENLMDMSTMFT